MRNRKLSQDSGLCGAVFTNFRHFIHESALKCSFAKIRDVWGLVILLCLLLGIERLGSYVEILSSLA